MIYSFKDVLDSGLRERVNGEFNALFIKDSHGNEILYKENRKTGEIDRIGQIDPDMGAREIIEQHKDEFVIDYFKEF